MTGLPARVDVVVIGAGLAGLAAAVALHRARLNVLVVEASDDVGGRVRTDSVDGLQLDRGFQLLNPSYPELHRLARLGVLDLGALDLRPFEPGVVVAQGGRRTVLADPRRLPQHLRSTLTGPGSVREKLALARWAVDVVRADPAELLAADDEPLSAALAQRSITGRLRTSVVDPFLAGVLADDSGQTSRRFVELLVRAFVRGTPALPAAGMAALPRQLAAGLAPDALALGVRAVSVTGTSVATDAGIVTTSATVVATDPRTATRLAHLPTVAMRGLTTYYHLAETAPSSAAMLHLDGGRRGPLVNSAVVSNVAPAYAGGRGALVATTVLGAREDPAVERAVRAQLRLVYGADPRPWELVATYAIPDALPAMLPPLDVRQPVDLRDGLFVAGDHRDTASIQGALVSGRRAATAVLAHLGVPEDVHAR
ncbi:NAD(P)/FAD-dependent oxidoreductase [Angustibacter luteus]|uniref:NAD(P)/FAD-dependent oxidoreductase n=1 Tax=Angustibacter luteus TaxID=658456 RepID=A0ABW1JBU0_9ACTN